jgi:hypothetical protein
MGTLTEAMTHLRGEIESMRGARFAMIAKLAADARDRSVAVAEMRHGFARAHSQMARSSRAFRSSFLSELRRSVASRRRDFRGELTNARRAWWANGSDVHLAWTTRADRDAKTRKSGKR